MKPILTCLSIFILFTVSISWSSAQKKKVVDSLTKVLESNPSVDDQFKIYLLLAKQHVSLDSQKTANYLQKLRVLAKEEDNKEILVDALFVEGKYFDLRGKRSEAIEVYTRALKESLKIDYKKGEALAYARTASTHSFIGRLDTASTLYFKAIELQKSIDDMKGLAFSYHGMGNYNWFKGNLNEARNYYLKEIEILERVGDGSGLSSVYLNVGNTYARQGIYLEALEYFFKAAEDLKKRGNKRYLALVTNNIGNVFYDQENHEDALKYYHEALDLRLKIDDPQGVADCYSNIGIVHSRIFEMDKAVYFHKKALAIREELDDKRGIATTLMNLGVALSSNKQEQEALEMYERSVQLRRSLGDKRGLAEVLINISKAHLKLEDPITAYAPLKEGIDLAEEVGSLKDMRLGYSMMAILESQRRNYRLAFDAHVRFKELADSLINSEQTREITKMEADFKFQQERDSVAFEQAKVQLGYEQEIKRRKVINQAAIGGGILVLIILGLLYRSYLIKQKSNLQLQHKNEMIESKNEELTFKNEEISALRNSEKKMAEESLALKERELTNITMLSYEKNELLLQIGEQIGKIDNKVSDNIIPDLKEIKRTIKSNISDDTWNSFTYHFEQVHPEFFNKLKSEYEDLNQNDLRLCAYIKVGLTNKVIAQMGNVTHAAVKKNINRLKKKLEIGPDESLRDFMIKFI